MGSDRLCERGDSIVVSVRYRYFKNIIHSLIRNETVESNIPTSEKLVKLVWSLSLIRFLGLIRHLAFLNTRAHGEKNSLPYIHNLWHIHTLFCVIFSGKVFCGKLAELPHTPTCFISCWEKVKEV